VIHLAVETSTSVIDMSLLKEDRPLSSLCVQRPGGASEILVHGLECLLRLSGVKMQEIGRVSSSEGPGTYTSLRVGHLFCQGLAFGLGISHRTVSPFLILAEQVRPILTGDLECIIVLLDARRGEVNACILDSREGNLRIRRSESDPEGLFSGRAVDPRKILDHFPSGSSGVIVGPGVIHIEKHLSGDPEKFSRFRVQSDLPRAETMGRISWARESSGQGAPGGSLPLVYGRDSVIS
jgi:tRNA threonylcarbamoyl adenosine modification protein YeaZ